MAARHFWIGSYAAKGGLGLYPLAMEESGALSLGMPSAAIRNASFALAHPHLPVTWFVNEQDDGRVVSAALRAGEWQVLADVPSGGALPCFLARHPAQDLLAVANYGDGKVALLPVDPVTGAAGAPADLAVQPGRGPDPERQEGPHAHCVVFSADGEWLYQVDLGLDSVLRYPVRGQQFGPVEVAFEAPPGSGARHLAFLPDQRHALLVCELAASCMLLRLDGGRFACLDCLPTAPPGQEDNLGGDLRVIGGDTALVTNRGHDSVAVLRVAGGRLRREHLRDSAGVSPRHVIATDRHMLVAHEEAGGVVLLPLPGQPGSSMQSASIPGAAFILEQQEYPCAQP